MSNEFHENAALIQKHQIDSVSEKLSELESHLEELNLSNSKHEDALDELESEMDSLFKDLGIETPDIEGSHIECHECIELTEEETINTNITIGKLDFINFDGSMDWQDYVSSYEVYAQKHSINLKDDPFEHLLSHSQKIEIEKRIKEEFTLKSANCDKYDYMIAGTCGVIGGLIDILFVDLPGSGKLSQLTDEAANKAIEKFASLNGWKGPREGKKPTKSAIGYLEKQFRVNYDQKHSGDVNHLFKMRPDNHHLKNFAHSPDLLGLFSSLLSQFTDAAHFVDNGKIISVDTETFELSGGNFIAKLFAGITNWIGHLFSDMGGSSGAETRGAGIPIPFYSMFQFCNFGEFGQHKQSFSKIATQVFEKGYDFRHGLAMAIPVLTTELLIRLMWSMKSRFYHDNPWSECIPSSTNPELRRMLLVGHGTLCMLDATDAALRSGGEMIQFLLRTNLMAWARFGHLALKELKAYYPTNSLDTEAVNEYLEAEYKKLLIARPI